MKLRWMPLAMILSGLILLLSVGTIHARGVSDKGPGCGLGKLAWQDYPHPKNIAPQVMMATTNASFGSQTFGISFGTSGCTNDGKIMVAEKLKVFASINFENLSQEMAQGYGEHLTSLATLMGVPVEQHPEFFVMIQTHYQGLVKSGSAAPTATITALYDAMGQHPSFAQVAASR